MKFVVASRYHSKPRYKESNQTTGVSEFFHCPGVGIFEEYFESIFFHWLGLASIEPREKEPFRAAIRYVVPGFIRVYLWAEISGVTECCWVRGLAPIAENRATSFPGPGADLEIWALGFPRIGSGIHDFAALIELDSRTPAASSFAVLCSAAPHDNAFAGR